MQIIVFVFDLEVKQASSLLSISELYGTAVACSLNSKVSFLLSTGILYVFIDNF